LYHVEIGDKNFTKEILENKEASVVYFTTLNDTTDVKEEYKHFNKMARFLQGAIKIGVFRIDKNSDDFKAMVRKYKLSNINEEKPVMRFYPNGALGDDKSLASESIPFDKDSKDLKPIYEEISSGLQHDIQDVHPNMFQ
jgi:hypothetical protein